MQLSGKVCLGLFLLVCAVDVSRAVDCGAGQYVNATGACADCAAGTVSWTVDNSTQCTPCPAGSYQWQEGQQGCFQCPTGSTTNGGGKDSASACVCEDEKYLANINGNWACAVCPAGLECTYAPDLGVVAFQEGETWVREGEFEVVSLSAEH
eukprot:1249080-Rhodomonas_salina.1